MSNGKHIDIVASCSLQSMQQRRNIDARKAPSDEEGVYIKNLDGTKPVNRMFGASFQCSHLVAKAHDELLKADGTSASTTQLKKIVNEIRTFEGTLVRLFRACVVSPSTEKRLTEAEVQTQWLSTCPTYRAMAMWIFLKASRITLHQLLLQCLQRLSVSPHELSDPFATLIASSDAILSSIPYMTEPYDEISATPQCRGPKNIGGYYCLWPLHIMIECRYIDKDRQDIAREALLKIGHEMGLSHALEIARVADCDDGLSHSR